MENKDNKELNREKEIKYLLDKIETLDHTIERNNSLSIGLLNAILDDYYYNDFNGSTLDNDNKFMNFTQIERADNTTRVIRLLKRFNGITEDNMVKVNIALNVINALKEKDTISSKDLYHRIKSKFTGNNTNKEISNDAKNKGYTM